MDRTMERIAEQTATIAAISNRLAMPSRRMQERMVKAYDDAISGGYGTPENTDKIQRLIRANIIAAETYGWRA